MTSANVEVVRRQVDATDVPIAQPHAMVYEFRDGQIVRLRSYLDHAEARAAADAMQA
jgi:ketosteroid isomerase-like protein